jgi:DNA repair protein RadC
MLKNSPCEQLIAIALDTQLKVIGSYVISSGTLDSSLAHPREAFRVAILLNAGAIIIAHNHPSGSLEPSGADWKVYERFKQAGELLGIGVIDSLITNESQAYSMEAHK